MKFQIKTNSLNFRLKNAVIKEYPELENIEITPSKEEQNYKSENYYGYDEVKVNGVTSEIDNNIKPENIKEGVDILGVSGNVEELNGEELTITKNGEYIPTEPINAYTKVIADVPVGEGDPELAASYLSSIDDTLGRNTTKLPDGITSIGKHAFRECSNLALTSLPNSITYIGSYAFNGCRNLNLKSLPSGLLEIDSYAFDTCSNLNLKSLPSGLLEIGDRCFSYCSNLALTSLPDTLTTLGDYAFQNCSKLNITSIPAGVTEIPSYCFRYCSSLTEITMHGNVTTIDGQAFSGCSNLAKIVFPNVTGVPKLSNTNAFNSTPIANGTGYVYFPDSLVDSIKSATNWSTYANQIKGVSEL